MKLQHSEIEGAQVFIDLRCRARGSLERVTVALVSLCETCETAPATPGYDRCHGCLKAAGVKLDGIPF